MAYKYGVVLLALFIVRLSATTYEYYTSELFIHAESRARILGGVPADEGSFPYVAAITLGAAVRRFLCAGSLVTTRLVLTAAHCITAAYKSGSLNSTLGITVGTNMWYVGGQSYNISGNVTHPEYDGSYIRNDLGFLIVATDVALSITVQLVPLSFEYVGGGVETTVAGWGRVNRTYPLSSELLELDMTTVEGQQCVQEVADRAAEFHWRAPAVDPRLMLCAYHSVNHGVCNGDSGSPLIEVSTGRQCGLVSWGLPCAVGAPDMFTRLSNYEPWIKEVIHNNTVSVNETKV